MKKGIKGVFLLCVFLFLFTFFNRNNRYYENESILTEEAILEFEKDLKEGKTLQPSHYISPKKDYNNSISRVGMKCSHAIEKVVNMVLTKILNSIEVS